MVGLRETDEIIYDSNLVANQTIISIFRKANANSVVLSSNFWNNSKRKIFWSKYQIKETDMRQKTATFSSPNYFDLTTGQYVVLITSPYHENFGGVILSVEYNEDTGMYDYQCQDFTRPYLSKVSFLSTGDMTLHALLRSLLTFGGLTATPSAKDLEAWKYYLAGLLPAYAYEQSQYGSAIKFNPMTAPIIAWVKDKRIIDVIQDLIYGTGAYIDVYADNYGVLQIEPYNVNEWLYTGLQLRNNEITTRKPKFDTTNILTGVRVYSNKVGVQDKYISSQELITLDLSAFFGAYSTGIQDPTENNTTKSATSTTNNSANTTNGNPYGLPGKKVWICADGGSGDFKTEMGNKLKNKGWDVHISGTGPSYHYNDYFNVTKDYVYCMIANGFCAGSVREAYSTKIQNVLKSKNVKLVMIFDTRTWTDPKGMKPYRYGDFTGYNAGRAWDDNFSSSDPSIKNVMEWLKKNNALWCSSPSVDGVVDQFLAGGYLKWANK